MSAAWIQELDILHYCRWPLSFMPIGPLWWFFFPSPSPQWQMPAQSKSGNFPCEKQEQKSANLISCAVLSAVTVGKKLARQTTLLVKEWYQVHHGNIRNICNKSHTMQEKKMGFPYWICWTILQVFFLCILEWHHWSFCTSLITASLQCCQ